jgi:hypothetical protein
VKCILESIRGAILNDPSIGWHLAAITPWKESITLVIREHARVLVHCGVIRNVMSCKLYKSYH